jgi:protein-tyrosine phosphatase
MKDIYWIRHEKEPRLAIVSRPRGDDWLEEDLANLKRGGIEVLISLLTPEEALNLGLLAEGDLASQAGIEFISYPIPDRTTPAGMDGFRRLIARLVEAVQMGKRVGAHCRASIGRSSVTTAAVLIQLGVRPAEALAMIEEARGCPVPDTDEQLNWILNFEPEQ